MTGYFIRFQRDGKWQPVEVDELTEAEAEEWMEHAITDAEQGKRWVRGLLKFLRESCFDLHEAPPSSQGRGSR